MRQTREKARATRLRTWFDMVIARTDKVQIQGYVAGQRSQRGQWFSPCVAHLTTILSSRQLLSSESCKILKILKIFASKSNVRTLLGVLVVRSGVAPALWQLNSGVFPVRGLRGARTRRTGGVGE